MSTPDMFRMCEGRELNRRGPLILKLPSRRFCILADADAGRGGTEHILPNRNDGPTVSLRNYFFRQGRGTFYRDSSPPRREAQVSQKIKMTT